MNNLLTWFRRRFFSSGRVLLFTFFAALSLAFNASAEIRLPHVFGSHMVLQRQKPIVIWGWAQPGEIVTVKLDSSEQTTQANDKGEWKVTLPAMEAGGPYELTISGSSTIKLEDILIGEVWLCSGQSNMEFGMGNVKNSETEIAQANHPNIRLLLVARSWTNAPQSDIEATWKICTPQSVTEGGWNGFSAVAYYFGRELNQKLNVPVGLVESDWGGTRIESWTPPEGFAAVPALSDEYQRVELGDPHSASHQELLGKTLDQYDAWLQQAHKSLTDQTAVPQVPDYPGDLRGPQDVQQATALYNGMIHPLVPIAMRGAIWYQGEANESDGMKYFERMKALIGGWRTIWNEGDFPFYFVQIAPYKYGDNPERLAQLWEAQTAAANNITNAGMAVVNDIGNLSDIHPKNKLDVGHRLALMALARTYGQTGLVDSGPTFDSLSTDGNALRVKFSNVGGGLASRDSQPLDDFEIIDADHGGFVKADARIDGDSVVLTAPGVDHPVAMRFAWSGLDEPNLMNVEGLPAGAFRAGTMPQRDWPSMNVPEARDYQVVYQLDLTKLGHDIHYDVDNHGQIQKPFDRIAYFVELQDEKGNTRDLFVSMDAFTTDAGKIGVPYFGSGEFYQQNVSHMNVFSSEGNIVTGTGLAGGNIEFWPNNYGQNNSAHVPHASNDTFDFGDQPSDPADGYGSMQVHNHDARQTLFAINHWSAGSDADVGIGNQSHDNPDWTFAKNASNYPVMKLVVLVREKQ
jgi:sialate O-acetylesterase